MPPPTPAVLRRTRSGKDPETGLWWLSDSALRSAAGCDTRTALAYGLRRTTLDARVPADVGSAIHEAEAVYLKSGGDGLLARRALHTAYEAKGLLALVDTRMDGKPEVYRWDNISRICAEWWSQRSLPNLPYEVLPAWVEVPFVVRLAPGIIYFGIADTVVRNRADGYLYVRDLKTTTYALTGGNSFRFWGQYRRSTQGTGYVWAAGETLGEPIAGFLIDALHLGELPSTPSRKCKTHTGLTYAECGHLHLEYQCVPFARTPVDVAQWRAGAAHLARRFIAEVTSATSFTDVAEGTLGLGAFQGACVQCDFVDWCMAGREPSLGPVMTVEQEEHR